MDRDPLSVLTPGERRVAGAVGRGATTKAVARELGVSVKTVDFHLGRIYRKLGIGSRGELAYLLGRETAGGGDGCIGVGLPAPRTSLVGREADELALRELVSVPGLVTVLGTGGVGKTQLALTAARASCASVPRDAWFVDLVSAADAASVVPTVARSLGLRRVSTPAEAVSALSAVRGLVVLDCCEHVLDAVRPLVTQLVASCTSLTIVATSRERLGVSSERIFVVRPLSLAIDGGAPSPAAQLFRLRWSAISDSAGTFAADASAVERVCARLDGLPLAIELAAARLRAFDLAALERGVGELSVSPAGDGGSSDRHQSLAAAIGWSYHLLSPSEQRAFEALSVFNGSFDLEAARAMIGGSRRDADDALVALIDKSLVVPGTDRGSMRYRMLDTVREFAWERAHHRGIDRDVRRRFVAHVDALVAAADADVRGPEDARGHQTLVGDWHNVRAAIATAIDLDDVDTTYRLLANCLWWVLTRTRVDLDEWYERALAMKGGLEHPLRPTVSSGAAIMASLRNDQVRARTHLARAFAEDERAGGTGEPWPACAATVIADETRDLMEQAQSILDRTSVRGDPFWRLVGLFQQSNGFVYALHHLRLEPSERDELIARIRSNLAEAEHHRNPNGIGFGTAMLGTALREVDPVTAQMLLERAIALAAPLDIENTATWAQRELCFLHAAAGHHRAVLAVAVPAIRRHLRAGSFSDGRPLTFVTLGTLIIHGHAELAARAYGSLQRDYTAADELLPFGEVHTALIAALGSSETARLIAVGALDPIETLSREIADACDRLLAAPRRITVRQHGSNRRAGS